jgi:hypothetical protein
MLNLFKLGGSRRRNSRNSKKNRKSRRRRNYQGGSGDGVRAGQMSGAALRMNNSVASRRM